METDKLTQAVQDLADYMSGGKLSRRAAAWAAAKRLAINPLPKHAREHEERNGGHASLAAKKALEQLSQYSDSQLERYTKLLQPYLSARHEMEVAQLKVDRALRQLQEFEAHPKTEAEVKAEEEEAADRWWQKEGRFEEEIEERGESKYFHAENDRRRRFGYRALTPREYLKK